MVDNERIVTALCMAFERLDADELVGYFAEDAVYHNVPLPELHGRQAIHDSLAGLPRRFQRLRVEMLHQISRGDLVMNERIDTFTFPDGKEVALPIAGVFELRDGKIQRWRDYFDLATFRG